MALPYFTPDNLNAFGSSGSLNNAYDNFDGMSTNDVSVEGIAKFFDIATDNAMPDHTGILYNYPPATNNQMPVLHGQDMFYHYDSASMEFGNSGDPCVIGLVPTLLAVPNGLASTSRQTPRFVPQQSYCRPAFPSEAADSGHPPSLLGGRSSSSSAYDRRAPFSFAEGMQFSSPTNGRSFTPWAFGEVPNGTTRTSPPNFFDTDMTYDAGRSLRLRETDSNQSTLPESTLMMQKAIGDVQNPERLPVNSDKPQPTNNRKNKPRSQQEQATRDGGSCYRCKSDHKKCAPNNPNDPYGPCARCTEKSHRPIINRGDQQFSACQRMYKQFSDLLEPRVTCDDDCKRLLRCIQIDLIFGFLDINLPGVSSREVEMLASLKTYITLATIHKFCSSKEASGSDKGKATWIRRYDYFFGMALYHWEKACESLKEAYFQGIGERSLRVWIKKVAAAFAHHISQPQGYDGLPQGMLDTKILKQDLLTDSEGIHRAFWHVVGMAPSGTKERGLFSRDEAKYEGIPLQLLPPNFETDIGSKLLCLPEELSGQEVDD